MADNLTQRRANKLKICEENLKIQTKKLYEIQRDFYNMMPRIYYDVQLTILKSIISIQSQFLKLTDLFDKTQLSNHNISKRMRSQITNAAISLMQMIREENKVTTTDTVSSTANNSNKPVPISCHASSVHMIQGYELSLQRVLESLLLQSQIKGIDLTPSTQQQQLLSGAGGASVGGGLASSSQVILLLFTAVCFIVFHCVL